MTKLIVTFRNFANALEKFTNHSPGLMLRGKLCGIPVSKARFSGIELSHSAVSERASCGFKCRTV